MEVHLECYTLQHINSPYPLLADDNSLSACDKNVKGVVEKLQQDLSRMILWFESNLFVANPEKFQLMFLGPNIDKQ